jgi:hypothetical protein
MASRALKIDPKKVTSDPDVQSGSPNTVDEGMIATRAYEIWQQRGCPIGSGQADWFKAEGELNASKAQRKSAA